MEQLAIQAALSITVSAVTAAVVWALSFGYRQGYNSGYAQAKSGFAPALMQKKKAPASQRALTRAEMILANVEAYDGTSEGQREVK